MTFSRFRWQAMKNCYIGRSGLPPISIWMSYFGMIRGTKFPRCMI